MGLSHICVYTYTHTWFGSYGRVWSWVSLPAKWKALEVSQWEANLLQQGPLDRGLDRKGWGMERAKKEKKREGMGERGCWCWHGGWGRRGSSWEKRGGSLGGETQSARAQFTADREDHYTLMLIFNVHHFILGGFTRIDLHASMIQCIRLFFL